MTINNNTVGTLNTLNCECKLSIELFIRYYLVLIWFYYKSNIEKSMVRILSNKIIQRKTFLRRVKSSFRSKKSQKVFVPPDINVRVRPRPANKGDPEVIVRRSSRSSTDEESGSKSILTNKTVPIDLISAQIQFSHKIMVGGQFWV